MIEADARSAMTWLASGRPLPRPLTDSERLAVAIAGRALPDRHLSIDSPDLTRDEIAAEWDKLKKRISRSRQSKRPLIYFGCFAQSVGGGGYHAHMLLWEYIHLSTLRKHLRELRFGHANMRRIERGDPTGNRSARLQTVAEIAHMVAYVIGQHDPIFGSRHHQRHTPHPPNKKKFIYPHRDTLRVHKPELLAALQAAGDPATTDVDLIRGLPIFSSSRERKMTSTRQSSCQG